MIVMPVETASAVECSFITKTNKPEKIWILI